MNNVFKRTCGHKNFGMVDTQDGPGCSHCGALWRPDFSELHRVLLKADGLSARVEALEARVIESERRADDLQFQIDLVNNEP